MNDQYFKEIESRMTKCVEATRSEFASIRTGRATPALLDRLHVDAYGQSVPLKQVAGVSVPDTRTLVIAAWDKGVVSEIKKAIEKSDLGLTPNVDGSSIRLDDSAAQRRAPQRTGENRQEEGRGRQDCRAQRPAQGARRNQGAGSSSTASPKTTASACRTPCRN